MGNAVSSGAIFSPTSLNFGVHSYTGSLNLSANLTIENISAASDQYSLGIEQIDAGPAITFSQNSTGSVAPGSSATIVVSLQATAPGSGGFQGFVTITSSSSSLVYRIPYWAGIYVPDASRVLRVSQNASGSGVFDNLADALAAAQPGNIIEIEDSASYPAGTTGLVISTNSQGLPLHGITIRAASGQTPVIDGSALSISGSPADIQVIGLQNVLLKGLNINGGYTGIELYQPSTTVPLSVTIDQCDISNNAGDLGASGIWIDGGGTIEILHSIVSGSSGPGIIAGAFADGTQLTVLNDTVQANGNDGMDVWGANVVVSNSTFTGNSGAGTYFDHCSGTLDGNTFSQNQTSLNSFGDGLQIADGNLVVRNNLSDSNNDAGVALFPGLQTGLGPNVQIMGNTIRHNSYFGIYSASAVSVLADSNLIEDNAGGIFFSPAASALLLNNIIARSADPNLGDGVAVAGASTVRIVNNTIYMNALRGVELISGTVSIANTIVFGNTGGNLLGVGSSSVDSSLISIDPNLTNPALDDFSLAAGSRAIDAGSNTASNLPFLDYHGQLRNSTATGLPGAGTVDIGAEEANSAYPLVYPLILNGAAPAIGGSFVTGIAFSNPTTSAAQVNLTAFDGAGGNLAGPLNPASEPLPVEGQLAILDYQLFGFDANASVVGSVLASTAIKLAGFDLFADPQFSLFSTGANATSKAGTDLVFMRHESDANGVATYVIFNPGVGPANITATLHGSSGSSIGQSQTATIPPKGQSVLHFNASALSSGYVRIQSDRPVSGMEIVGTANRMAALGGFSPDMQSRLFFPHFAVGGNYSTQVAIVNSGPSAAHLTLTAYDDNGNLIGVLGSITLQAGGQLVDTISNLFGISATASQTQTGYLVAEGDQPGIMGYTDFTYDDGIHSTDATIPADSVPSRSLVFSHIAQGVKNGAGVPYSTGIALLNPFGTEVTYTMSVYDGTGALVAQGVKTIGPHQKVAKILFFPVAGIGFFFSDQILGNGHVEVTTDYGLLGLELFFTDNLSQLASVPAQVQ
jgi:hypothetical protein